MYSCTRIGTLYTYLTVFGWAKHLVLSEMFNKFCSFVFILKFTGGHRGLKNNFFGGHGWQKGWLALLKYNL